KNHITFSKVKGWEGAIALITDEYEGLFLSPQYPTFSLINENETDIKFVEFFLMQKQVWKDLLSKSVGIGARRNSISENRFLSLSIPIPPLSIQQNIVATIEKIKSKLKEVTRLREEQQKELDNLLFSKYTEITGTAEWVQMKNVAPIHRRPVEINIDETY